jgi:hypothetical protein
MRKVEGGALSFIVKRLPLHPTAGRSVETDGARGTEQNEVKDGTKGRK